MCENTDVNINTKIAKLIQGNSCLSVNFFHEFFRYNYYIYISYSLFNVWENYYY